MRSKSQIKVLCYIVTYNASRFIEEVLNRIPEECWANDRYQFDVLISDDCSPDDTVDVCKRYIDGSKHSIKVSRTKHNLGYGGNQKLGYDHAIHNGYDAVVLLHGDAQYGPEYLPALIDPILDGKADVMLGSRMMHKKDALKGRMPWYKFIGNITLTQFQNYMLGSKLAEFHTGLRAYSTKSLSNINYRYNSDGYVFDTEILIQHINAEHPIGEIPIATRYGDEECNVNGIKYALRVVRKTLAFRMHKLGFCYLRQYDKGYGEYQSKTDFYSSHRFAIEQSQSSDLLLDIGGGSGHVAGVLHEQGKKVHGLDSREADDLTRKNYTHYVKVDLDSFADFTSLNIKPDTVLLLDILEHLKQPERLIHHLRDILRPESRLIITLPNVAFFSVRVKLLFGFFNYGSRGTMDHTHLRFFTFSSIVAMLKSEGYKITHVRGIPAPFPLVIKWRSLATLCININSLLIAIHKGLFAYQIAVIAQPKIISHDS
jgi:glycosyltransferase involved in cell wall biosynthesis